MAVALLLMQQPAHTEPATEVFNPAPGTFNPTPTQKLPVEHGEDANREPIQRLELDLVRGSVEERVERILGHMTLDEKIGQLCQTTIFAPGDGVPEATAADLRAGRLGSIFYTGSAKRAHEVQRIAQEESRLGLPILAARDVIHGFRTVFPIPLGQAASWNPALVERASAVSAQEAKAEGVNWTFAPMLDICRDARWGRIAESPGEDPTLAAAIAGAMVRGFQGAQTNPQGETSYAGIAACAKHFVAYGLSEGGRDYNRSQVAISELHNVFLRPFHAAVEAGCLTLMTSFSSINGVPGTGNKELLHGVLKRDWSFDGLVVSDWTSVLEMIAHGFAANEREAAVLALEAGVDMEMVSTSYHAHLRELVETKHIDPVTIDDAVRRVLRVKLRLTTPSSDENSEPLSNEERLAVARDLARQSIVLLKNDGGVLPLVPEKLTRVALIGPMADAPRDQLGCWVLDGKEEETMTPTVAIQNALAGRAEVEVFAALETTIDDRTDKIAAAVEAAKRAEVALVCVGEGWKLSGEARCRVDLDLPGAQSELVREIAKTGTPLVLVVMAGRPLTIGDELDLADAVLYAWHPGTMGGPALADLLLGIQSPSGRLPVTFPKHVGQLPLYYNHPSTGRPALEGTRALLGSGRGDFPEPQKYRSHYLDSDPFPLLPFGFGLTYSTFEYGEPELTNSVIEPGQTLGVRVRLTNTGKRAAEEVSQLYVRDVAARLVRPVRELKAFRRTHLEPGESVLLEFALSTEVLAYFNNRAERVLEPGEFRLGVGGDSTVPMPASFTLREQVIAGRPAKLGR